MDDRYAAEEADIIAMFEHPGWTALQRRTQEGVDQMRAGMPFTIPNEAALHFTRGYMTAMQELLTLRDRMTAVLEPEPVD